MAGTANGDPRSFARDYAPDGLILYVEASESPAFTTARDLWRMRLACWLDHANAVLVERTNAPDEDGFSQRDAVRSAFTELIVAGTTKSITQQLR